MSISHALGNSGASYSFDHGGKTYAVRHLDQSARAAFEQWLKKSALDTLSAMRGYLSPADLAEREEAFFRASAAGEYSFYGVHAARALETPAGVLRLAAVLFDATDDEIVTLMTERQDDVIRLMKLVKADGRAPAGNG